MDEFPDDIRRMARRIVGKPTAVSEAGCLMMARLIASALLDERERCRSTDFKERTALKALLLAEIDLLRAKVVSAMTYDEMP